MSAVVIDLGSVVPVSGVSVNRLVETLVGDVIGAGEFVSQIGMAPCAIDYEITEVEPEVAFASILSFMRDTFFPVFFGKVRVSCDWKEELIAMVHERVFQFFASHFRNFNVEQISVLVELYNEILVGVKEEFQVDLWKPTTVASFNKAYAKWNAETVVKDRIAFWEAFQDNSSVPSAGKLTKVK